MSEHVQLFPTETYKLNGVTYVPHFRNVAVFVGPGYPRHTKQRYTADELVAAGAVKAVAMLWSRSVHGKVDALNP